MYEENTHAGVCLYDDIWSIRKQKNHKAQELDKNEKVWSTEKKGRKIKELREEGPIKLVSISENSKFIYRIVCVLCAHVWVRKI